VPPTLYSPSSVSVPPSLRACLLSVPALQLLLALRPGECPSLLHQDGCSVPSTVHAGDFPCRRCQAPHYYQLQQKVMVLAQYLRPAWLHRSRHSWQYCAGRRVTIVVGAGDTRKHTEVGKDWGRHGGGAASSQQGPSPSLSCSLAVKSRAARRPLRSICAREHDRGGKYAYGKSLALATCS